MAKKKANILSDSFEQVVELGKSTAKKAPKNVVQSTSPSNIFQEMIGSKPVDPKQAEMMKNLEKKNGKNHTPLEMDKLKEQYAKQDVSKEEALRNRLFQLGRNEEERVNIETKQKKQQKEQEELAEERDKKRKEEEKRRQEETQTAPRGKQRRSIFSPKKKAQEQHAETRPATGKQ